MRAINYLDYKSAKNAEVDSSFKVNSLQLTISRQFREFMA